MNASAKPEAAASSSPSSGPASRAVLPARLFVIAAPSGAGKTSLIRELTRSERSLKVSVSHTTRPRRAAEVDTVDYHFVTPDVFARMRSAGEFLEWATVYGHCYGTARHMVDETIAAGCDIILEIDWQGAEQVRRRWRDCVSIFVLPPSRRALAKRLAERGQDRPEVIAKRTAQAVEDISHHIDFDYLVVNDDFRQAVADIRRIVHAVRAGKPPPRQDHAALLAELLS